METITIKLTNPSALKLLEDLVAMRLIEVSRTVASPKKHVKLSKRLSACINAEQAELMRKEIIEMGNEREQNI